MIETINTTFLFTLYIPLCFIFNYGIHKGSMTGNASVEDIVYIFGKKVHYFWCFVPFVTWIFVFNIPRAWKTASKNSKEVREKREREVKESLMEQLNEPLRSTRLQREQRAQELLKQELMKDNKGKLIL